MPKLKYKKRVKTHTRKLKNKKTTTVNLKYDSKYYDFLDGLRESGAVNMFGAGVVLRQSFPNLTHEQSQSILSDWMKTFSERHRIE